MESVKNPPVIMILQSFYPLVGGTEKQALELSLALREKGVPIQILTRRLNKLSKKEFVQSIPVVRLQTFGDGTMGALGFMMASFFYLLMHARSYQIIHVHLISSHAIAAVLAGFLLSKKVVIKMGGGNGFGELAQARKKTLGRLKMNFLSFFNPLYVVVSESQKKSLAAFGVPPKKVLFVPNGVNTKTYAPVDSEEKNRLRKDMGWKGTVFLLVGRLSPDKWLMKRNGTDNFDALADFMMLWSKTVEKDPESFLYVVGDGPMKPGYLAKKETLKNSASIEFLGNRDDVRPFYQAADVFVLPSIGEGQPNALFEAMASGLPVLGSRVEGIREHIKEEKTGFLFDLDNQEEIECKIEKIKTDSFLRKKMGTEARTYALTYSIGKTADKYLNLYRD